METFKRVVTNIDDIVKTFNSAYKELTLNYIKGLPNVILNHSI